MTTTIARSEAVAVTLPRRRWWSLPDSIWSGLARGFGLGVVLLMLAFGAWDQTTGWLPIDLLLWGLAGVLWLALFDGVISLLLLATRGVARVFGARGDAAHHQGPGRTTSDSDDFDPTRVGFLMTLTVALPRSITAVTRRQPGWPTPCPKVIAIDPITHASAMGEN